MQMLQWGRGFSAAETGDRHVTRAVEQQASMGPRLFSRGNLHVAKDEAPAENGLQWGRGFSAAETVAFSRHRIRPDWLQWGRGFSAAETSWLPTLWKKPPRASMGPRLFSRGNFDRARCVG